MRAKAFSGRCSGSIWDARAGGRRELLCMVVYAAHYTIPEDSSHVDKMQSGDTEAKFQVLQTFLATGFSLRVEPCSWNAMRCHWDLRVVATAVSLRLSDLV